VTYVYPGILGLFDLRDFENTGTEKLKD
jgi:hypothetical protein